MYMKFTIITKTTIMGGLTFLSFGSAWAIEPAADESQPPAALLEAQEKPPVLKGKELAEVNENSDLDAVAPKQQIPFLGLSTAAVPQMLVDHLGLEPGSGLMIRMVCPGSPAEKAGLSVNDVILKIGDSKVGNPGALSSVVRGHSIGERVGISLIHKGKPAQVEVTLAERPAELAGNASHQPMLEGLPQAHADRLRGLIDRNRQAFGNEMGGLPNHEELENQFREMKERMKGALEEGNTGGGVIENMNSTVRMMDGNGSIEIRTEDGSTNVTVRDTANEVTWSGPWDTEEEQASAPDEIRERVNRVKSGAGQGFKLRFGKFGKIGGQPNTIEN